MNVVTASMIIVEEEAGSVYAFLDRGSLQNALERMYGEGPAWRIMTHCPFPAECASVAIQSSASAICEKSKVRNAAITSGPCSRPGAIAACRAAWKQDAGIRAKSKRLRKAMSGCKSTIAKAVNAAVAESIDRFYDDLIRPTRQE